jgi:hypothetical protein
MLRARPRDCRPVDKDARSFRNRRGRKKHQFIRRVAPAEVAGSARFPGDHPGGHAHRPDAGIGLWINSARRWIPSVQGADATAKYTALTPLTSATAAGVNANLVGGASLVAE